ncbi:MAG: riboflavin biosynthesis protein RibF [Planctomycetota bacterium]
MRTLHGLEGLEAAAFRRPVVTVGTFDGLHRGHVALLEHLGRLAARMGGERLVVTFAMHPMVVIRGAPPRPLVALPRRLEGLARLGVDTALVLPFDARLRALTWQAFFDDILVHELGLSALLFGYNGNFGHGGLGTFTTVRPHAERLGVVVEEAEAVLLDGRPVSSTRIRDAIQAGDLATAERLLGHPPAVAGPVVRGDGRGRQLGFPTANVDTGNVVLPPAGVYEVRARVADGTWRRAVANLGRRPTVETAAEGTPLQLEVHLPGFDGELYGHVLEVAFVRYLRDEQRFADLDALVAQIRKDVARVVS